MDIICPLCQQTLSANEKYWHCANRHSFDVAKQGYINLLPVQHKKSKSPGDDAAMVAARSQFLNGGYYQPLSQQINRIIIEHLQHNTITQPNIIDAGCGEGYYTSRLGAALSDGNITGDIIGIDISKHAILAAARRDKTIRWFVASSNAIPVATYTGDTGGKRGIDTVLSLFAPIHTEEFYRCLNTDGLLLVASTGNNHLIEMRELLYDDVRNTRFDPVAQIKQRFAPTDTTTLDFTIDLDNTNTIKQLFAMTPHYWRVSPTRQKRLDSLDRLTITVDINLHSFKPV